MQCESSMEGGNAANLGMIGIGDNLRSIFKYLFGKES